MTFPSSKAFLAFAVSTVLAGPAFAQAQGNSCSELINALQNTQSPAGAPITLDQARMLRDNNNLQACRQALTELARRAHAQAGVSATVTPRDFRSSPSAQPPFGQQSPQMNQQQARPAQQVREEQGRVVNVRPARVRGVTTPNYLVVIETQPGRRVVADIGQDSRGQSLQQGTPIAVRGQIVRVGNRGALLLADAIRVGNQTYDVNRPAFRRTGMGGMAASNQQLGQSSGSSRFQERSALRRQLRQAGFRNIRILNAAYLVQARTPDGRGVLMMVDPPQAALLAVGGMTDQQRQSPGPGQSSGADQGQRYGSNQGQPFGSNQSARAGSDRNQPVGAAMVMVERKAPYGQYLVDANGRALYALEQDPRAESTCYGACAEAWPPMITSTEPAAGDQAVQAYVDTITRKDGRMQVTYNGKPLYYYVRDRGAGAATGQDVHDQWGGWYLVAPEGTLITATRS